MAQSNGELRQEFAKLFKSYSVGVSAGMLATRAKTVDDAEEHLNAVITLAEQLFTRYRKQHELEARIDERSKLEFHWEECYDNAKGRYYKKIDSELHDKRIAELKAERERLGK